MSFEDASVPDGRFFNQEVMNRVFRKLDIVQFREHYFSLVSLVNVYLLKYHQKRIVVIFH